MATQQNIPQQFYRLPHLKQRLGVSGSTIWNWIKQGKFPRGTKLSENITAWDRDSIEAWEKSRIAASQGGSSK
jgi:prophage regulatory protein